MKPIAASISSPLATIAPLACATLMAFGAITTASAEPIDLSPVGLDAPESTVTFSEHVFADMAQISTEFADLGVTFLPNLFYRTTDHPDWASVEGPNLRTGDPEVNPFTIHFVDPVTSAAFVAIAQPPTPATITAKLNGVVVESFDTTVSIDNPDNYFGFTGIEFDEIEVSYTAATRMRIDNIQLGMSARVVPLIITKIDLDESVESKSVTLIWQSRANRTYSVFASEDLQSWTELDDGVESGGDETSFTEDQVSPETTSRYYRVEDSTG
jgi:hypothetical protein